MKNKINLSKHLLWCIVLLLVPIASKLNGQTCSNATVITSSNFTTTINTTDSVVWFTFNSNNFGDQCRIQVSSPMEASSAIQTVSLFSGVCNNMNLVQQSYRDLGMLICESTVTANTSYLIRLSRPNTASITFTFSVTIYSLPLICPCPTGNCQLVCNPTFEQNIGAPFQPGVMWSCKWSKPAGTGVGTPDFFNDTIGTNWAVQVPNNFAGSQSPRSPGNYCGFYAFYDNPNVSTDGNYREYIQTKLSSPLIPNVPYRVSYWVSLADRSSYAVSALGAYFSSTQPGQSSTAPMQFFTPQITHSNIITNTSGWTLITDTLIVTISGVEWMTIGNFQTDATQNRISVISSGSDPNYHPEYGSYYYIEDVTVEPLNSTALSISPSPACTADQLTILATSSVSNGTWNWTATNGASWICSNLPGCQQIIDNPPLSSAVYTANTVLPAYNMCTDTASISSVIFQGPISCYAGPDVQICLGGSVTLSGSGSGTYNNSTWSTISGNLLCSNCTNFSVSPTSSIQYIFAVTNTITGCALRDTINVTVSPLSPVIVSPPGATTCSGCFNFTTASNYSTYFWSTNAVNSSGGNTSTLNACWGAPYDTSGLTGNVSVSVVDANGCQGSAYIFVPSCCPFKEGQFSSYPNLINDSTSRVDNFTYPSLYNYNTTNGYYEASNKQFSINGVYVIDRDTRFIGCEVKLGPNAKIIVRPGKKFEMTNFGTTVTKLYACTDMWDGIYVDGINTATKVTVLNGTVIEDAKNAIVSTNGGNFFLDGGTTFNKLNKNNIGILIKSYTGTHPGIIRKTIFSCDAPGQQGATSGVTSPGSNCRAPISGTSHAGIYIENCSNVTVGDSTVSTYRNLFERTKFGVYSFKSNVKVWNNDFKYFTTTSVGKNVPSNGIAVYASSAKFFPRTLTVGKPGNYKAKNKFTKCSYGTFAVTWVALLCEYNRYDSCSVQGITAMNTAGQVVTINADTLTECTGTNIQCTQVGGSNVTITRNLINQLSNFNLTNFGHTGILVSNSVLSYVNLKIQYNTIKKMKNGIWVSRVKNAKITDNSQINFMAGQPMSQSNPCIGIKLEEVNNSLIRMNGVGFPNAPTQAVHDEIFGVHMTNCVNDTVTKNTFSRMGSAIFLKGANNPCMIACNTMTVCWFGVNFNYLNGYGAGVSINDQITWSAASTPYSTANSWTSCTNDITGRIQQVNGNGIKWYYNGYNPNVTTLFTGSLFNNATAYTANANTCSLVLSPPPQSQESIRNYTLGGICKTPRTYDTLNSAYQYHDNVFAYRMLLENPSWKSLGTPDDSYYSNFFNTHSVGNIGKFAEVEDKIANGAIAEANSTLATIVPAGQYEINRKTLLEIYLTSWANDSLNLDSAQQNVLMNLVHQSTLEGGTSVFDARNMLHLEVHDSSRTQFSNPLTTPTVENSVSPAYPNPTHGVVSFDIQMETGQNGTFEVFDLSGRLVSSTIFKGGENHYSFDLSELPAGTYIYLVRSATEFLKSERIIILKP